MRLAILLLAALSAALGSAVFAAPARAGEVCNETSYVIEAAIAWRAPGGVTVQGWNKIRPGDCIATPPAAEVEQYLYARTTAAYPGGVREWRGVEPLCVGDDRFTIQSVADCEALAFQTRGFRRLTAAERRRATLVEPADFGERAQEAGIQRLLQAAGYDIRVVDGYEGRRTRREIAAFEAAAGREYGADRAALIDALEQAALARNAQAGLVLCNAASEALGFAVARRRANLEVEWESRGWWRAAPGECVRAVAEAYEEGEVFVHARKIVGGTPAASEAGAETFCTNPARFLAEGRADCEARGYETDPFMPAPAPGETGRARLEFADSDFPDADIADLLAPDRG